MSPQYFCLIALISSVVFTVTFWFDVAIFYAIKTSYEKKKLAWFLDVTSKGATSFIESFTKNSKENK